MKRCPWLAAYLALAVRAHELTDFEFLAGVGRLHAIRAQRVGGDLEGAAGGGPAHVADDLRRGVAQLGLFEQEAPGGAEQAVREKREPTTRP
jgi:hypothetical protein